MYKDEVIEEVWKNRDKYAEQNNNDLTKIVTDIKRRQVMSKKKFVDRRNKLQNIKMI